MNTVRTFILINDFKGCLCLSDQKNIFINYLLTTCSTMILKKVLIKNTVRFHYSTYFLVVIFIRSISIHIDLSFQET